MVFNAIIAPIQSSLGALLAIFLGAAAVRMAQRRRTWGTLWFLLSAIVVLLTQIPVSSDSILLPIRQFFDALAMGGSARFVVGRGVRYFGGRASRAAGDRSTAERMNGLA